MPDGATSVVGVEQLQRVRDVVDRLFAKRHMHTQAYDVVTTDEQPPSTIDLEALAICLTGREVVAEERAVVRFTMGGRAVGVRCRGTRRLRRVLWILRELMPPLPAGVRAMAAADQHWLHPDLRMRDLHGQWLTVYHVPADDRTPRSPTPQSDDDDTHDVLIIPQEDRLRTDHRFDAIRVRPSPESQQKMDALTKSQFHGRATASQGPSTEPQHGEPTIPVVPPRVAPSPIPTISECGETEPVTTATRPETIRLDERRGRVDFVKATTRVDSPSHVIAHAQMHAPPSGARVALRPGAPLDAPDFVEGVRPTPRQSFQPFSPNASTPPPLPPKPARLPTFV